VSGDVEVHLFAAARAAVGSSTVTMPSGTVSGILSALEHRYPAFARVRPQCSVLVDEVAVHGDDVEVAPGSRMDVLPPFAGG
jgi:molybdopterin synthase sulfur carrier subunit